MVIKNKAQHKLKMSLKQYGGICDKIVIDMFNTIEKESTVTEERNMSYTES